MSCSIIITVANPAGEVTNFKINPSTIKMRKVFKAYYKEHNMLDVVEESETFHFFHKGNHINENDTAQTLGLKDGDQIDFQEDTFDMNTTNNNCNKEDYSMDNSTAVLGKLGGSDDTDDIISDEELFKQPPNKDCPICLLRLPELGSGIVYKSCCGKMICSGCNYAPVYDNLGNELSEKKCPFCRTPVHESDEEYNERLQKRVEVGDAMATFILGCNYYDGEDGFPQDYDKAFELFVRAGELGHNKAYCNIGCAYEFGNGVDIDKKKADHYFKLAAIRGNVISRYNLGVAEEEAGNWDRALKHYMVAAEGGYDNSLKALQELYTNGHATKDDYATSLGAYQAYLSEIKSTQREADAACANYRYY